MTFKALSVVAVVLFLGRPPVELGPALLGQAAPEVCTVNAVLGWDLSGKDTAGGDTAYQACEVALFAAAADLATAQPIKSLNVPPLVGTNEAALRTLLEPSPAGLYKVSVRVSNLVGWSAWAAPLEVRLLKSPPTDASGCRLLKR